MDLSQAPKEVIFAIISTSVVLISIFIPIIFLEGDTAKLFKELAITIIGAIFFSTIVSLTLTPMLCSRILQTKKNKPNNYLENKYIKILSFLLEKNFFSLLLSFL